VIVPSYARYKKVVCCEQPAYSYQKINYDCPDHTDPYSPVAGEVMTTPHKVRPCGEIAVM